METNPSVLRSMLRASELGQRIWPEPSETASHCDFTRAQLFACLVVRESLKLSYRRADAFLRDVPDWLAKIDLRRAPDHNTLWRAFGHLLATRRINKALDLLAAGTKTLARELKHKPLTVDSTCYEPRHRSKHYDRVCRKIQRENDKKHAKPPGKWGKKVNASRSRKLRGMPKLSLAVAAASHRILSSKAATGNGSDAPDFDQLLFDAWRRGPVKAVVADAGFDSEKNHEIARRDLGVRSVMPPKIGRPTDAPPTGRYRRLMKQRFSRGADATVDAGPFPGDGVCTLRGRDVVTILEREFGVKYSLDGAYDLLERLGYSCLTPRPRHEKADPEAAAKFKQRAPFLSA